MPRHGACRRLGLVGLRAEVRQLELADLSSGFRNCRLPKDSPSSTTFHCVACAFVLRLFAPGVCSRLSARSEREVEFIAATNFLKAKHVIVV